MTDSRAGLNCSLAYRDLQQKLHTYRCRVAAYSHGYTMIAEEGGQSRFSRAFYPHRVTVDRFTITVQLKGYKEWESFNIWMTTYGRNLADANLMAEGHSPVMSVMLAGREFNRVGIPVSGYGFGDHLGAIMWQPLIEFESATDPYNKDGYGTPSYYRNTAAVLSDQVNAPYFYPFGQFASGSADSMVYDQVVEVSDGISNSVVQNIINGTP